MLPYETYFLLTAWYTLRNQKIDTALGPRLEVKICDRFRSDDGGFQLKPVTGFYLKVWS